MAVTIKKKKKSVKTIKAKSGIKASSSSNPSAVKDTSDKTTPDSSTKPLANGSSGVKEHSYIIDSIVALVAIIIFAVLLSIQAIEISYYKAPLNVWPNISLITRPQSSQPQSEMEDEEGLSEESSELEE